MKFKGYVIDLEGTIFQNGSEILGSFNFIRMLQSNKVPFRVITNTVSKSTEEMATLLKSCGLEIPSSYILNPIKALNYYLEEINSSSYFFVGPSYIQSQLSIPPDFNGNPKYVILCDFENISLSYNLLNQIFSYLLNGASLMSTSYSDFYLSKEGYKLDTGSFTKMFEIVGNQKATILGKPSSLLYEVALKQMCLNKHEVIAIGDDVLTDIKGAKEFGLFSVLVKTGKYKEHDEIKIPPNLLIDRLEDVVYKTHLSS